MSGEVRVTTALEVARAARALLRSPGQWTKGANARRFDWSECRAIDPEAVCWSLYGAIYKFAPGDANHKARYDLVSSLSSAIRWTGMAWWNDHPSTLHAHVLAELDGAIEHLEKLAHAR